MRDHFSLYGGAELPIPNFNPDSDTSFDLLKEECLKECDRLFTSEEARGRFVDMNSLYLMY